MSLIDELDKFETEKRTEEGFAFLLETFGSEVVKKIPPERIDVSSDSDCPISLASGQTYTRWCLANGVEPSSYKMVRRGLFLSSDKQSVDAFFECLKLNASFAARIEHLQKAA